MVICSCHVLSDRQVRSAMTLRAPPRTIGELFRATSTAIHRAVAARSIKRIMDEHPANAGVLPRGVRVRSSSPGRALEADR